MKIISVFLNCEISSVIWLFHNYLTCFLDTILNTLYYLLYKKTIVFRNPDAAMAGHWLRFWPTSESANHRVLFQVIITS